MTLGGPGDAGGMLVPSACHFSHLQPLLCTLSGIYGEWLCRPWGYPDQLSLCLRLNTVPGPHRPWSTPSLLHPGAPGGRVPPALPHPRPLCYAGKMGAPGPRQEGAHCGLQGDSATGMALDGSRAIGPTPRMLPSPSAPRERLGTPV